MPENFFSTIPSFIKEELTESQKKILDNLMKTQGTSKGKGIPKEVHEVQQADRSGDQAERYGFMNLSSYLKMLKLTPKT